MNIEHTQLHKIRKDLILAKIIMQKQAKLNEKNQTFWSHYDAIVMVTTTWKYSVSIKSSDN